MKIKDVSQGDVVIIPDCPDFKIPNYEPLIRGHTFGNKMYVIKYISKGHSYDTIVCYEVSGNEINRNVPHDLEVHKCTEEQSAPFRNAIKDIIFNKLETSLTHGFWIGADPEIFVEDEKGIVVPAFNFLGSKEAPTQVNDVSFGKNNVYWDGFQAEFDTQAQSCVAYHTDNIQNGLRGLYQAARKFNPKAKLSSKTIMDIPEALLSSSKEEHVAFGCNPSQNVYGLQGRVGEGRYTPVRTAGGHLHFGIGYKDDEAIARIVKTLDAILAVSCVSLFASVDKASRREMYGLAGEYRKPPHGLEYRTLSNAWLFHPLATHVVFDLARKVVMFGVYDLLSYWKGSEEETIEIIQTCNVSKAREVLARNEALFKRILASQRGMIADAQEDVKYNIFMNGIETAVLNFTDIETNWHLTEKDVKWVRHSNNVGCSWASYYNLIYLPTLKKKAA